MNKRLAMTNTRHTYTKELLKQHVLHRLNISIAFWTAQYRIS